MIVNRLKKKESTLSTYTTTGEEIIEGHILGYGDNYPCIVLYDSHEACFMLLEFGYKEDDGYDYRHHMLRSYTVPFTVLGHIDNPNDWRKYMSPLKVPRNFDYSKRVENVYAY
jgi:hypothetical protein